MRDSLKTEILNCVTDIENLAEDIGYYTDSDYLRELRDLKVKAWKRLLSLLHGDENERV